MKNTTLALLALINKVELGTQEVGIDLYDDHNWHCTRCFKRCEEVNEIMGIGYENSLHYSYRSGCCEAKALDLDDEEDLREWEEYKNE